MVKLGAVRRMRTRIRLLVQPEIYALNSRRHFAGATQVQLEIEGVSSRHIYVCIVILTSN